MLARILNAIHPPRITSAKRIVIALVLFTLATTIAALTQSASIGGTQVQLCVKENGQLRMTPTGGSCDPSERLTEWVVGGQVTEIQLGQGLIGNRDNGTVSLALDPSVFQSCIGCGKIIAGFNDGPLQLLPFNVNGEIPQIAKLELPAGSYAISAKLVVEAKQGEEFPTPRKEFAVCRLLAGNDFDESSVLLEVEDDRPIIVSTNDQVVLSLQVVHRFAEAGQAVLRCSKGAFAGDPPMEISNIKVVAIEGSSVSNTFLAATD
ncbi:MAG TPA: hypothetical protein VLA93_11110 [Pyrinomonadaceae bacterium]|nr:hypothetical protein [Pyrinomonadaceae bacterium]